MKLKQFKQYFHREILPKTPYKKCSKIVDGFLSCMADALLMDGTLTLTDYFTLSVVDDIYKGRDVRNNQPMENHKRKRLKITMGEGFKRELNKEFKREE